MAFFSALKAGQRARSDDLTFASLSISTESARQRITWSPHGSAVNVNKFAIRNGYAFGDSGMGGAVVDLRVYDAETGGNEIAHVDLTLTTDTYAQAAGLSLPLVTDGAWVSAESDTAGDLVVRFDIEGPGTPG